MKAEARRLGVRIVETKPWDGTRIDSTSLVEKADRVLVDAPCSGLGVIRRKPEIKYKKNGGDRFTSKKTAGDFNSVFFLC